MKNDSSLTRPGTIVAVCAEFGLMFGLLWFGNQSIGILYFISSPHAKAPRP